MRFIEWIAEKWQAMSLAVQPVFSAMGRFFAKTGHILMTIWSYILKLRKFILAAPVVVAAFFLARMNMERLPDLVGLDLQTDGTFSVQMTREIAVLGPIALTAICLMLMFCSKRVLTPWVVSIVTLIVPIFIWFTNVFPA